MFIRPGRFFSDAARRFAMRGERPVLIDETGATRSGRELVNRVDRLAG